MKKNYSKGEMFLKELGNTDVIPESQHIKECLHRIAYDIKMKREALLTWELHMCKGAMGYLSHS